VTERKVLRRTLAGAGSLAGKLIMPRRMTGWPEWSEYVVVVDIAIGRLDLGQRPLVRQF